MQINSLLHKRHYSGDFEKIVTFEPDAGVVDKTCARVEGPMIGVLMFLEVNFQLEMLRQGEEVCIANILNGFFNTCFNAFSRYFWCDANGRIADALLGRHEFNAGDELLGGFA